MLIAGVILMIQGFGSALTEWLADGNWGLLAWAEREFDLPSWAAVAVDLLGLALCGTAWLTRAAKAAQPQGFRR